MGRKDRKGSQDLREFLKQRRRLSSDTRRTRSPSPASSASPPTKRKKHKHKDEDKDKDKHRSRRSPDVNRRVAVAVVDEVFAANVDKDFRKIRAQRSRSRTPSQGRSSRRRWSRDNDRDERSRRERDDVVPKSSSVKHGEGTSTSKVSKKRKSRSRSRSSSLTLSSSSDNGSPERNRTNTSDHRRSYSPPRSSWDSIKESGWRYFDPAKVRRHRRSIEEEDERRRRRRCPSGEGRDRRASLDFERRGRRQEEPSWEEKVKAFMKKTGALGEVKEEPNHTEPTNSSTGVVDTSVPPPNFVIKSSTENVEERKKTKDEVPPPPPGLDASAEQEEDLKSTPLVRYIGKKLAKKKTPLKLEGVFKYNLLSLLSRAEWVAAKTIQLLEEAGYSESSLYMSATTLGGPALETELKSAVFTGKVKLESKPELVAQVLRVIERLVKYFTSKEDEKSSSEEENAEPATLGSVTVRGGVGELLKNLKSEEGESKVAKQGESEQKVIGVKSAPNNPWSNMWDRYQCENLRSFEDMKVFISKNLLHLGQPSLCPTGGQGAFAVGQDMVSCLVVAGYSLQSLRQMVMQAAAEDILPPKEQILVSHDGTQRKGRKFLYDVILERLEKMRNQMPELSKEQLEYLVRKCLTYVMRGCDKAPAPAKTPAGFNIVFNHIPPGLREMERKASAATKRKNGEVGLTQSDLEEEENSILEDGQTPQVAAASVPAEVLESTDPLNSILKPAGDREPGKPNELPARRYLVGYIHAEWLTLRGRPHLYEVSVFFSDLSSMTVYMVPEAMQKQPPEVLDALGFVANPDRPEFYFVQVGVGVIKTLSVEKAVERLAKFFEEKRHTESSENKNSGLVLNFYSEEEMAIVLDAFERCGHKNIFLDTVKGVGYVEAYVDRNKSKNLEYSGPRVSVGGTDCFFHTTARRGVHTGDLVSKSKAEALQQCLEFFLESPPTYRSYLREYCFPPLSTNAEEARRRHRACLEMYPLEVFLAARLKAQGAAVCLEGPFAPPGSAGGGRELRDKHSVLASRVCRTLVITGYDLASLRRAHERDVEFAVNSSVFLDRLNVSQRLKLMDQTMRCIRIIQNYFSPAKG